MFKNLDDLAQNYKIFWDTCSIMECSRNPNGIQLATRDFPVLLRKYNNKFILPFKVIEEINKNLNSDKEHTKKGATEASKLIKMWLSESLVDIKGEPNDPFADQLFQKVFTQFRLNHNLVLITNDSHLAEDIRNICNSKSARTRYKSKILKINKHGYLEEWGTVIKQTNSFSTKANFSKKNTIDKFKVCTSIKSGVDTALNVNLIPALNDYIGTKKYGTLMLTKIISETGGEGIIYATNKADLVCKIYRKDKLTTFKQQKLELMLSKEVNIDGVCWPVDIAHNNSGQFVGYLMPMAQGDVIQKCLFTKPILQKTFPHWNKTHLLTAIINIIKKIEQLHQRNILIGDINPQNILIKNEKEIYFVDADSYQIEEFPCPVGFPTFTPAHLQGKLFDTFLRTQNDELFAVAVLMFMMIVPGKHPYSQQGGGTQIENIASKKFPYKVGNEGDFNDTPKGAWAYIWHNLSRKMKEKLYDAFGKDKLPTVKEWKQSAENYLYALEQKVQGDVNFQHLSLDIFPTTWKMQKPHYFTCSCGNKDVMEKDFADKLKSQNKTLLCGGCREKINSPKVNLSSDSSVSLDFASIFKLFK